MTKYVQLLMGKWGSLQYYKMSYGRVVEKDSVLQYCYTGDPLNAVYLERVGSYDPVLFDKVILTNGKYVRSQWTCNLMHMASDAKQVVSCLDDKEYDFMMLPYSMTIASTYLSRCAGDMGLIPLVKGGANTPATYVRCVQQTRHLVYSSNDQLSQSCVDQLKTLMEKLSQIAVRCPELIITLSDNKKLVSRLFAIEDESCRCETTPIQKVNFYHYNLDAPMIGYLLDHTDLLTQEVDGQRACYIGMVTEFESSGIKEKLVVESKSLMLNQFKPIYLWSFNLGDQTRETESAEKKEEDGERHYIHILKTM